MKILVTGGAGFIASHIVDAYLELGHKVAVVDNLSMGNRHHVNPQAEFHQISIQDSKLDAVFESFNPDIINHHAAHINLRYSVENPTYDAENNILGTLNILQNAVKYGSKKIIFASTGGAIYGEPAGLPVPETEPAMPLSPYGAAKLSIEHYIRIWNLLHNLKYTIFRYPNVYGPRQNPKGEAGVIAIFTLQMLGDRRPTIFGDGSKTRDYLYISDLVKANITALEKGDGETLNLGWGREITDQEVFDTVAGAIGYSEKPVYSQTRPGEVERIALDAGRAAVVLNWRPEIGFEEGVRKSVNYYIETKNEYSN
ncbi:MAG: NAD-dependent epimerase/dehydratase family protein [bacterium]